MRFAKNNNDNLGVTADDGATTDDRRSPRLGRRQRGQGHCETTLSTHIIAALAELDDLDGTSAQNAAIRKLDALLTLVDRAVTKTMFTDTGNTPDTAGDLSNEAMAVADALNALGNVKSILEASHVDPDGCR